MATAIVAVGCYYGYTASGGPVGVGQATAKSMILNMVLVHLIGMMGSQCSGARRSPRAPIGGRWLAVPRTGSPVWATSSASAARPFGDIFNGRVFRFFGQAMRQAGILILGLGAGDLGDGLHPRPGVRDRGRLLHPCPRARRHTPGVFAAWCDLREMVPYMFGYIMAAKVGTGIVAELGAMRINEEIDALEVMGVRPITFLAATRLLAAWMVLPFIYIAAVGVGFLASYLAVVQQIGEVSARRLLPDLLDVPEPARPAVQRDQGRWRWRPRSWRSAATTATPPGRPRGRGTGDRQVDDLEHGARAPDRHDGLQVLGAFEGADPDIAPLREGSSGAAAAKAQARRPSPAPGPSSPAARRATPSPCTASRSRRPASCRRSCARRARPGSPPAPSSRT